MLLEITADGYDSYDVHYKEVYIETLLQSLSDYALNQLGLVRLRDAKGETSDFAKAALKNAGWINARSIQELSKEKELMPDFFIVDEKKQKIDLEKITNDQLRQLANGSSLVQKVKTKSVLSPTSTKAYDLILKKKKQTEEVRKKREAKKATEAKQLEIEKARKILQEAGELK